MHVRMKGGGTINVRRATRMRRKYDIFAHLIILYGPLTLMGVFRGTSGFNPPSIEYVPVIKA